MLHIGLLINTLNLHGGVRRCVELANALVSAGQWVTLYTPKGDSPTWWPCAAEMDKFAKVGRQQLDAIVLFGFDRQVYNLVEASGARVKVFYVVSLNELDLDGLLAARSPDPASLFVDTIRRSDWLVCACATWIRDWVRDNLNPDVRLLLGGVNHTIFHPAVVKKQGLPYPIVMSSGDRRGREGSVAVKEAVDILRKRWYPDATWETYFKRGIPQSQMAATIRRATVWLDGQWYAGWANAVIEAMACRVPVVCTDIGGVRDFAVHEQTALLVPVEDREAMAEAVARMLEDDDLRHRLVDNAYRKSMEFDYAMTARELLAMILERL